MKNYTAETRTFVGESDGPTFDGFAGFHIGQTYRLQVEYRSDGMVAIALDHHEYVKHGVGPLVISEEQYGKWFREV